MRRILRRLNALIFKECGSACTKVVGVVQRLPIYPHHLRPGPADALLFLPTSTSYPVKISSGIPYYDYHRKTFCYVEVVTVHCCLWTKYTTGSACKTVCMYWTLEIFIGLDSHCPVIPNSTSGIRNNFVSAWRFKTLIKVCDRWQNCVSFWMCLQTSPTWHKHVHRDIEWIQTCHRCGCCPQAIKVERGPWASHIHSTFRRKNIVFTNTVIKRMWVVSRCSRVRFTVTSKLLGAAFLHGRGNKVSVKIRTNVRYDSHSLWRDVTFSKNRLWVQSTIYTDWMRWWLMTSAVYKELGRDIVIKWWLKFLQCT